MIYVYEFLFTFFMAFFCSDLGQTSIEQGFQIFFTFAFIYAVNKKVYVNISLCLSFLVTAYRSIAEVIICLVITIAGSFFALLMLTAAGYSRSIYKPDLQTWQIVIVELVAAFFVSIVYYCMFVDLRMAKEFSGAVAVAAMYGAFTIAFPQLPAGNFIKVIAGFNTDMNLVMGSLAGQVVGSLAAGLFYKIMICENSNIKKKELDIGSQKNNISF